MTRKKTKPEFAKCLREAYGQCVNASIADVSKRLNISSRTTVHRYLHELVDDGVLQVEGAGTFRQVFIFNSEAYTSYVNGKR